MIRPMIPLVFGRTGLACISCHRPPRRTQLWVQVEAHPTSSPQRQIARKRSMLSRLDEC